jgi:nucleoside-diphosphate-sugar epimerase
MRRLLIIGCGDIGLRMLPLVRDRYRVYALSRSPKRHARLRELGVIPVPGDLDDASTLTALAGLATDVAHCAPPQPMGPRDLRTARLIAALAKGASLPQQLVYISTSGVYGDCAGALVDETRPLAPLTPRAQRRADAERQLRVWARRSGVRVSILRAPGIYAADRLPVERLARGTPALAPAEDAYVNHVHAEDLARMMVAALHRGMPNRSYNAVDDEPQKMGDYFDAVADACGLPRPPRVPRARAERELPETLVTFLRESRQLSNRRLKRELRYALRYPTVREGIAAACSSRPAS